MLKAIIKTVKKGKLKGQFRFVLKAKNGEIVGQSWPETYVSLQGCLDTLRSCFPNYLLLQEIDDTKELKELK